jgi:hypothetical protein
MTDDLKDKKVTQNSLAQLVKLGSKLNSFHKQVIEGAKTAQQYASAASPTSTYADMSTTVIFPDCSGSMSDIVGGDNRYGHERGSEHRDKVYYCREAVTTFIDNCFAGATRVGIASFPELVVVEPTLDLSVVKHEAQAIDATGGTPMDEPLDFVIHEWTSVTHGIIISDGCPDSEQAALAAAQLYKEKGVKLDTVHIGDKDERGESLMKKIAELTGGVYIKFSNVKNFAENFKFLTPQHRLTLTTSKNPIALLGAADVKL